MARIMMRRSSLSYLTLRTGWGVLAVLMAASSVLAPSEGGSKKSEKSKPFVVAEQGSFAVGGTVLTNPGTLNPVGLAPDGQTIHGDHAYVEYQSPPDARKLPLVLWHGGGQFSKTWETTLDGREGFETIFLGTVGATIAPVPGPAVLISHSASGLPGWLTQIKSPNVKAIVSYFQKLTTVPIQLVYGDNIPATPNTYPGLDIWRGRLGPSCS